nr:PaaI family thioesterase [Novosphingobium piscinae]
MSFAAPDAGGFNASVLGPTLARRESETVARVRIEPQRHLANAMGHVHGGALLGFSDMSLFAALRVLTGRDPSAAVTLDLTLQFIAPGKLDRPLDAVVELLRETGRLAFLRGVIEQDGTLVASFQSTVRKLGLAA